MASGESMGQDTYECVPVRSTAIPAVGGFARRPPTCLGLAQEGNADKYGSSIG
jgi:hypothetical protein